MEKEPTITHPLITATSPTKYPDITVIKNGLPVYDMIKNTATT